MSPDEQSDDSGGMERRDYLQGLAASGLLGGLGVGASGTAAAQDYQYTSSGRWYQPSKGTRRSNAAQERRDALKDLVSPYEGELQTQYEKKQPDHLEVDGRYIDVFTKGLPEVGSFDAQRYEDEVIKPLTDPDTPIDNLPKPEDVFLDESGPRQFVAPHAAMHYPSDGMDSWMGTMPDPPAYTSDRAGAEMLDCYWMALLRDAPLKSLTEQSLFDKYEQDADAVSTAVDEELPWLDTENPFRGSFDGSTVGPYISQFYTHSADLGNLRLDPTVKPFQNDHLTQYYYQGCNGYPNENFQTAQQGQFKGAAEPGGQVSQSPPDGAEETWISTGRELASLVRDEVSVQHYIMAAAQLFGWGASLDDGLPYTDSERSLPYLRYGGAGIVDMITRSAHNAVAAAWYHKWGVHRRLRPETYGGHVHETAGDPKYPNSGPANYPIPDLLLDSNGLEESASRHSYKVNGTCAAGDEPEYVDKSYLLPQAYPEGGPQHPAYPSGHSVLAGAGATVLKAYFQDEDMSSLGLELLESPDSSGAEPVPTSDGTSQMTVHSEINKLADNVGVARIWAGVHYWADHTYGAKLGEQMAVATMLDELDEQYGGSGPIDVTFTPLDPDSVSTDSNGQVPVSIDTLEQLREANTTR